MIQKATLQDLEAVLDIYAVARTYMKEHGNPTQWGEDYPPAGLLEDDILREQLYLCREGDMVYGVFAFITGADPTYAEIEQGAWPSDEPYSTIHRIAGSGQVKGTFHHCVEFCKQQADNIRIDTHKDNLTMQHLIEKEGFVPCGIISAEDGTSRIAYQYGAKERTE